MLWTRETNQLLDIESLQLIYFNTYSNGRQEALKLVKNIFYSFKTNSLPSQLSKWVLTNHQLLLFTHLMSEQAVVRLELVEYCS